MTDDLVTIRVPKELKKRMKTSSVNWSRELRGAIERKLATDDRRIAASELDSLLVSIKPGFDSTRAIKESRRHHA
jgi:predicted DNA-binding protein